MKILTLSVLTVAGLWSIASAKSAPQTLLPRMSDSAGSAALIADTIRVIAIRVEFAPDTMSGTTGDGSFGSGIDSTLLVDPLPHNRKYFGDQLLFLKHFYEKHSNGAIFIDTTDAVYPVDDDSVYHLPYPMWHYNHNDDDYLDYGLASLFYDAWKAADTQNDDIDFPPYDPFNLNNDLYIVFHAGVGKDFAFDYDPTPFDIPSAYINILDLMEQLPDSITMGMGIPVDDGAAFVHQGIILPECENQEGYELGMHGHMVLLFGHHIGLKNLYNTDDGTTVTGWFGMMDQGSGKLDGLIPAPPSAWTKVYAGWAEPVEVTSFPSTKEVPVGTIIKVPITDSEYYLVENIDSWVRPEVSWDSLSYSYYVEYDDYPRTFELLRDSVSQYMNVEIDPVSGVLTDIDNWGVGRPASGLLIWHIDEDVINVESYGSLSSYGINNNPDHLGVFLEEADGAMDIGQNYTLFSAGYGTELGYPWDAFWGDNEYHKEANPHKNGAVSFGDDTFPDARSNSGALSHLVFSDFSMVISDTMSFTVDNDLVLPGFPKILDYSYCRIFAANLDGQPGDELIAATTSTLYAWDENGDPLPVKENNQVVDYLYEMEVQGILDFLADDFDGDGKDELIVVSLDTFDVSSPQLLEQHLNLFSYNPNDSLISLISQTQDIQSSFYYSNNHLVTTNGLVYLSHEMMDTLFCYEVVNDQFVLSWKKILDGVYVKSICEMPDDGIFAFQWNYFTPQKYFTHYDSGGNIIWQTESLFESPSEYIYYGQPVAGDIDRDSEVEVSMLVYDFADGEMFGDMYLCVLEGDGSIKNGFPILLGGSPEIGVTPPAIELIDLDGDGYLNYVFSFAGEGIRVYEQNGVRSDYFPFEAASLGSAVLAGGSGSDELELVIGSNNGITACNQKAERIENYPIAFGTIFYNHLLYSPDGSSVVLAAVSGDLINAYNTSMSEITWGMAYRDKRHSSYVETFYTPIPQSGNLMPAGQVYNWPNPNNPGENFTHIRYYLNYDADISISIYDMAGDKVDELHDTGIAQADNETVWDLSDISSGVYFARVEAKSGGQSAVKIIKVAVIK